MSWRETSAATERTWSAAVATMRKIYCALDGEMFLDSYGKDGTVNTAHPLGGCPMAERDGTANGVVDPYGESFNNRNLFVVDAGIVPAALGARTSHPGARGASHVRGVT